MRPDGLEANGEQVFRRRHAAQSVRLEITERLDRPDPPSAQVLHHALNEHPAEAAARELGEYLSGHQQHGVSAYRTGREGDRPRDVLGRRIEYIPGRYAVDIDDLSATAPLQQNARYPSLFLQRGFAPFKRAAWATGSSSQKTQRLHRAGRSSRLSSVTFARRRDNVVPLLPTADEDTAVPAVLRGRIGQATYVLRPGTAIV